MHGRVISAFISKKILVDWRRMSGVGRDLLACLSSNSNRLQRYDGQDCTFSCQLGTAEGGACAAMQLSRSQSMSVVWSVFMGIGLLAGPEMHV